VRHRFERNRFRCKIGGSLTERSVTGSASSPSPSTTVRTALTVDTSRSASAWPTTGGSSACATTTRTPPPGDDDVDEYGDHDHAGDGRHTGKGWRVPAAGRS